MERQGNKQEERKQPTGAMGRSKPEREKGEDSMIGWFGGESQFSSRLKLQQCVLCRVFRRDGGQAYRNK